MLQKLLEKNKNDVNQELELAIHQFIEAAGKISANMLGMVNRVGGQIYALLFLSKDPLSLDSISELLKISKSNISINIRMLEDSKLVRKVWVKGSRKDFYEASREHPKFIIKNFFDRIRDGINDSMRIINRCKNDFEKVQNQLPSQHKGDQSVHFILTQLSLLEMFYLAANQIFDSFYKGKSVDIEAIRQMVFAE